MHGSVALTPLPSEHRNHRLFTRCTVRLAGLSNTVIFLFSLFLPSRLFYLELLGSLFFCYLFSSLVQVAGHVFLSLPREVRHSPAPFSLATVPWVCSALSLHINCSTCCGVVQLHICSLFFWVPCLLPGYAPCFADFTTWSIFFKGVWEVLCFLCLEAFCGGQRKPRALILTFFCAGQCHANSTQVNVI